MAAVLDRRRWPLVVLALGCALLVVVLFLVFVYSERGQRLDEAAFVARRSLNRRPVVNADRLLRTIDITSVALIGAVIVVVGFARQRPHRALAATTVIAGANVTTQVLKRVLPGPSLLTGADAGKNFFPSGHATVAMSLALAAVLVASSRTRGAVAFIGSCYAAVIGVATLTAGWHRPSDAAAGFAVVTMWAAAVAAVGPRRRMASHPGSTAAAAEPAPVAAPVLLVGGVVLAVLAFVTLVVVLEARRLGRLEAIPLGSAYIGASFAIAGTAFVLTGALLAALRLSDRRPSAIDVLEPVPEV
jgi:membrane-associated phospholipid phosphatase